MEQFSANSADRRREQLREDGLILIEFPAQLAEQVRIEIFQFFARNTGLNLADKALEVATRMLGSISDEVYESLMPISRRFISRELGYEIEASVIQSLRWLFASSRIGINFIPLADRRSNTELAEDQLALYWRCVRPLKPDVAPAHTDHQFWNIVVGTDSDPPVPFSYAQRWKVWVPIVGCDGKTSIQFLVGSQKEASRYFRTINSPRGQKPSIAAEYLTEHERHFSCPFRGLGGQAVLFHDQLIHRGPPNDSKTIRISMEFTLLSEQGLPGT